MKLLILDKDRTLVQPKSGVQFVQHPEDQELIPGVAETLQRYANNGWAMAIASNQGGVGAGYKTMDEAIAEMRYCLELCPSIEYTYFCPNKPLPRWLQWARRYTLFFPTQCVQVGRFGCPSFIKEAPFDEEYYLQGGKYASFRKPGGLMLRLILANMPTYWDIDKVLYVGDRPEDEQAARNAGVDFMWADEWRVQNTR